MTSRTKVLVLTIIVMLGAAAAFVFRKEPVPEGDSPTSPVATPAGQGEFRPAAEKPAPVSHLTGRIESPEQPSGLSPQTTRATTSSSTFGLAATPSATGAYSGLPTPGDGAAATGGGGISASGASGVAFTELVRHRIADGDTLSSLAQRYLGSASRYKDIYELNREILGDKPDLLPIGKELKIPAASPASFAPASPQSRPMVPVAPRGSAQ